MIPTYIISNPASGERTGAQFVNEHVLPLIRPSGKYELFETTGPGSAEEYARRIVQQHNVNNGDAIVMIVSGGDGTVHEIVNGIGETLHNIRLVLCPLGTANALYSTLFPVDPAMFETEYRLQGIRAYLAGHFKPLTISKTCLYTDNNEKLKSVYGVVVTSTALHAAILHSAERLRETVKGIERFQIAAKENILHWYQGNVQFLSRDEDSSFEASRIYNPDTDKFAVLSQDTLSGPFAYFISTTNVDRLEPAFQISPLFSKLPPGPGELDLVVVRPLRDPAFTKDDEPSRTQFASKLMHVLQSAYQQGAHVKIQHREPHISVDSGDNSNSYVVEYIRTKGWRWVPVSITGLLIKETILIRNYSKGMISKLVWFASTEPFSRSPSMAARFVQLWL